MTAAKPAPRPGILDISPYVPGKSGARSGDRVFKLSSNESPLGPSPAALDAFAAASRHMHLYPDGSAAALRQAIAERYGLDAERIVCGAGSDELIQLLAHGYLGPGDEAVHTEHGFLVYPIAIRAQGAKPVAAAERSFTADVEAIARGGDPAHPHRLPRQPQQSDRHLSAFRRGRAPARGHCRRTVCWCSMRPMPNMSAAATMRPEPPSSRRMTMW